MYKLASLYLLLQVNDLQSVGYDFGGLGKDSKDGLASVIDKNKLEEDYRDMTGKVYN